MSSKLAGWLVSNVARSVACGALVACLCAYANTVNCFKSMQVDSQKQCSYRDAVLCVHAGRLAS